MPTSGDPRLARISKGIRLALARIEVLALFPLVAAGALWFGQQDIVIVTAFLLPALLAIQALTTRHEAAPPAPVAAATDGLTGLPLRRDLLTALAHVLQAAPARTSACLMVHIDEMEAARDRLGAEGTDEIIRRCGERLSTALRDTDVVARAGDHVFGIVLGPIRSASLDVIEGLARRLQAAVAEPVAIGGGTAHMTASIGVCTPDQVGSAEPRAILAGAEAAMDEARRAGPASLRVFSPDLRERRTRHADLAASVEEAFAAGRIRPWFQPQICTDTGVISGFEALARWHHPDRGVLTPAEFLGPVDEAGLMPRLGETMLYHALSALVSWDRAGVNVPSVAVNFSAGELRDVGLADRVKWEVDRFDLRPARLTVEILETVAAQSADDVIIRNIEAFGTHGFNLDLDDFGTGQASISNIRRFHVNRIKIDRSFVARLDEDPAQRAMVSAILSMAEHLGVQTLAEGVETVGEHSILAQLGCSHVQGFGIARPMPFEDTIGWIRAHNAKLSNAPAIGRRVG